MLPDKTQRPRSARTHRPWMSTPSCNVASPPPPPPGAGIACTQPLVAPAVNLIILLAASNDHVPAGDAASAWVHGPVQRVPLSVMAARTHSSEPSEVLKAPCGVTVNCSLACAWPVLVGKRMICATRTRGCVRVCECVSVCERVRERERRREIERERERARERERESEREREGRGTSARMKRVRQAKPWYVCGAALHGAALVCTPTWSLRPWATLKHMVASCRLQIDPVKSASTTHCWVASDVLHTACVWLGGWLVSAHNARDDARRVCRQVVCLAALAESATWGVRVVKLRHTRFPLQ